MTKDIADKTEQPTPAKELSVETLLQEVRAATSRESQYRKDAVEVIKIYEGLESKTEQYNILYSNVDTMQPALYNSTPRPIVQRRFKTDNDLLAKSSANLMQRLLSYLVQNETPGKASFDELMEDSTLAALLVSRGVTWFKYEAELQETAEGQEAAPQITYECVFGEQVPWNNFLHGYAKYWKDVPWVSRIHMMTVEEFKENFPEATLDIDKLKNSYGSDSTSDKSVGDAGKPDGTGAVESEEVRDVTLIPIYELWHREQKKVYFLSEYCETFLKAPVDDPLQLEGFFPCPRPLNFMQRLSSLVPTLLYSMYREQSRELNRITIRIQKLVVALKVRGAFDANIPELDKILSSEDNAMTPITDAAVLYAQNGSIDRALWMVPIKDLVPVLQQLYTQRQQIKQIIFEITGLADIMRGSTQASETLGAQEIKNQWGTLRLKRAQKRVQRYVRECLGLLGELAITKLQPERIRAMTQSDLPSTKDKEIAQLQMQQASMQAAQTGQQPPQPDPQQMALLQMPSFEEVISTLQDDLTRSYKIDIETNSTIDAEATEDKQDITDALTALGQTLSSIGPLVQQQILPFEAAKALMLTVCRKFKFGQEIEDQINAMKAPPAPQPEAGEKGPTGPSPEQVKAETDAALAKTNAEIRKIQMEAELAEKEHMYKMLELERRAQLDEAKFKQSLQQALMPKPQPAATPAKPVRK